MTILRWEIHCMEMTQVQCALIRQKASSSHTQVPMKAGTLIKSPILEFGILEKSEEHNGLDQLLESLITTTIQTLIMLS